jgi:TrkA domain protein
MDIRMANLPGIGKKMSIITAQGSMIVLVIHHTGKREMYFFQDADDDEADFSIDLTADETRELGAQLLGAVFQPVSSDQMKIFKSQIVTEWIEIKKGSPVAGKTIKELEIRKRTGVSIVGIFRGDEVIASPEPEEKLEINDTIMAIGKSDQIVGFERLCKGEAV